MTSPDELVARFVRPDTHVHLAMTPSRPNAATYALARAFAGTRSLTVSMSAVHSAAHALAMSGAVREMITGFLGDTYPTPRPNILYRDVVREQPFRVEPWSLLSLLQRLVAGGTGQPYAVTTSLSGSDLCADKDGLLRELPDPDGGETPLLLAKAMRPDVTVIHGVCADSRGNLVLVPPVGEGPWSAYAAKEGVLATVERIVPDSVLDRYPDRIVVPGQRVIGICEAPYGAHPNSLGTSGVEGMDGYRDDYEFLLDIARRGNDIEALAQWHREWVLQVDGHAGYLDKLGARRLRDLRLTRPPIAPKPKPAPQTATATERAVILGARVIAKSVLLGGYDTLLAGIGASHLAAWLAAGRLRAAGKDVKICAETGVYGQRPTPGDVFLFSREHGAEQFSGIAEVLGGMAVGNASRCLGVVGAGEVDPLGNINTCVLPDGRWITGSGGANDIVSAVDSIVVAVASRRRYVGTVAHVTSPGRRVREVVSQFGSFQRDTQDQKFHLHSWLPGDAEAAGEDVFRFTCWPAPEREYVTEPPITPAELSELRGVDPEGYYR
ncbi:MAG TPA: CoA-transferase [Pseudonocardiaceae bacterium]|nr:CoA-transferase [Pseudonocardiaceae bacterium]